MNPPAFYRLLVSQRQWDGDPLERLLAEAWQLLLLPDAAAPPASADR